MTKTTNVRANQREKTAKSTATVTAKSMTKKTTCNSKTNDEDKILQQHKNIFGIIIIYTVKMKRNTLLDIEANTHLSFLF